MKQPTTDGARRAAVHDMGTVINVEITDVSMQAVRQNAKHPEGFDEFLKSCDRLPNGNWQAPLLAKTIVRLTALLRPGETLSDLILRMTDTNSFHTVFRPSGIRRRV